MRKKLVLALLLILTMISFVLTGCYGKAVITKIEFVTLPKVEYVQGEDFEINESQIKVHFNNGTELSTNLTKDMIFGFQKDLISEQYIIIKYEDFQTTLKVTVNPPAIETLEIKTYPDKLKYIEGQNFEANGMKLYVKFINGKEKDVIVTSNMIEGYDSSITGKQTLSVKYMTSKVEFDVEVSKKELLGIEISKMPTKRIYFLDEIFDAEGGELFLQYSNGYPERKTFKELSLLTDGAPEYTYDFTKISESSVVKVKFQGKTTQFTVAVRIKNATTFTIRNQPKLQLVGKDIDISGLIFDVYYNNETKETITLPDSRVTIHNYNKDVIGEQKIQISLRNIEKRMEVTIVNVDKIESAIVVIRPDGEVVYQDNSVDPLLNWKFKIKYDNDTLSSEMNFVRTMFENPLNEDDIFYCKDAGNKVLHIKYNDLKLEYTFNVTPKAMTEIKIVGADRMVIPQGMDINTDNLGLEIKYNDSKSETVMVTREMITSYNGTVLGAEVVQLTYSNKFINEATVSFPVIIVKKAIGLGLNHIDFNRFILGDKFKTDGLVINISFQDSEIIEAVDTFNSDWMFISEAFDQDFKFIKTGNVIVYAYYLGLDDQSKALALEITVSNLLTSIDFVAGTIPLTVTEGMNIDVSNFKIIATYEDNSTVQKAVTASMMDYTITNISLGNRNVKLTYAEDGITKTISFDINVVAKVPSKLLIQKLPSKTAYFINETMVYDGLILTLVYNNHTQIALQESNQHLSFAGFDSTVAGNKTIKVVYDNNQNISAEFNVVVHNDIARSIQWMDNTNPTIQHVQGVEFTKQSLNELLDKVITINYAISGVANIKLSEIIDQITVHNFDKDIAITQIIDLKYQNVLLKLNVVILSRIISRIEFGGAIPTVVRGAELNISNAKILIHYANADIITEIPMQKTNINYDAVRNINGYQKNGIVLGNKSVSFFYEFEGNDYSSSVNINIQEESLENIAIYTAPKTTYIEGESFDAKAGEVTIRYNNGVVKRLPLSDAAINSSASSFNINTNRFDNSEFSGFSKLQTIFISYTEKSVTVSTSYDISMQDRYNANITYVDVRPIYSYIYGEISDTSLYTVGLTIKGKFDIAVTANITIRYEDRSDIWNIKRYDILPRDVGRYHVVVSYDANISGDKYNNNFYDDSKIIEISKRNIYVTISAMSKIYGNAVPTYKDFVAFRQFESSVGVPFPYIDDGAALSFLGQLQISVYDAVLSREVYTMSNVGVYPTALSGLVSKNFTINYINSVLNITKRAVDVKADNSIKEYGAAHPELTFEVSETDENTGLVANQKLLGNLNRVSGENVGTYAVTMGDLADRNPNYEIRFYTGADRGFLTIKQRKIYVKPDNYSKTYGQDNPSYFPVDKGGLNTNLLGGMTFYRDEACQNAEGAFAESDTKNDFVSDIIKYICDVTKFTNVGKYQIGVEGLFNNNYEIFYVNGFIDVLQRPIKVAADSHSKIYGDNDPTLTYDISNLDDIAESGLAREQDSIKGTLSRVNGDSFGTYTIYSGNLTEENPNYDIRFVSGIITINKKSLEFEIAESDLIKQYDGRLPFVNNYQLTDTSGNIFANDELKLTFVMSNSSKNIGAYPIKMAFNNSNFDIKRRGSTADYMFQIVPKVVEVEFTDIPYDMEYKGEAYKFGAKVQDSDICFEYNPDGSFKLDIDGNKIMDRVPVGLDIIQATAATTYTVNVTSIMDTNYELKTKISTSFEIKKRALVLSLNGAIGSIISKEYNGNPTSISRSDYTINNGIGVIENLSVFFADDNGSEIANPTNVKMVDGKIAGYKIFARIANDNFKVNMQHEYQYIITPKKATLSFYSSNLSKPYDGNPVSVFVNDYYFDVNTRIDPSSLHFDFVSIDQSNATKGLIVGVYNVIINCSDTNYIVSPGANYQYKIIQAVVTVTVQSAHFIKEYDGTAPAFTADSPFKFNHIKTTEIDTFRMINYPGNRPKFVINGNSATDDYNVSINFTPDPIYGSSDYNDMTLEQKLSFVGKHTFTIVQNDPNRTYLFNINTSTFTTNKKRVSLTINSKVMNYGDNEDLINYDFTYPENSLVGSDSLKVNLNRTGRKDNIYDVKRDSDIADPSNRPDENGIYGYRISYELSQIEKDNPNYQISSTSNAYLKIMPVSLGVYLQDIENSTLKYGVSLSSNASLLYNNQNYTLRTDDLKRPYPSAPIDEINVSDFINDRTFENWYIYLEENGQGRRISSIGSEIQTGRYKISFENASLKNYKIEIIDEYFLTIYKTELSLVTTNYEKEFGEDANYILNSIGYSGFKNGETKEYLIQQNMFVDPILNDTNDALDPTSGASDNEYEIQVNENTSKEMKNYCYQQNLVIKIKIKRSELSISIIPADTAVRNKIWVTYGTTPSRIGSGSGSSDQFKIDIRGFKLQDNYAKVFGSSYPTINWSQEVMAVNANYSTVANKLTEEHVDLDAIYDLTTNYSLKWVQSDFYVEPAKLYVGLANDIILGQDETANMFKHYTVGTEGDEGNPINSVIDFTDTDPITKTQFAQKVSKYNFGNYGLKFYGFKYNDRTLLDMKIMSANNIDTFNIDYSAFFATSEQSFYFNEKLKTEAGMMTIFDSATVNLPKVSLAYDTLKVNQSTAVRVSNIERASNQYNYEFVYTMNDYLAGSTLSDNEKLNIITKESRQLTNNTKVTAISADSNQTITDKNAAADVVLDVTYANNTVGKSNIADANITVTQGINMNVFVNQTLKLNYRRNISSLKPNKVVTGTTSTEDGGVQEIQYYDILNQTTIYDVSTLFSSGNIDQITSVDESFAKDFDVPVTVYRSETEDLSSNRLIHGGQTYSSATIEAGKGVTKNIDYETDAIFDKVYFNFIANINDMTDIANANFVIKLNGKYGLMFSPAAKGTAILCDISSGNIPIMGINEEVISIKYGDIDLFDGFKHEITVVLRKNIQAISMDVDSNNAYLKITNNDEVIFGETSGFGFSFTNLNLSISANDFKLSNQGYYDESGSMLTSATIEDGVSNKAIIELTNSASVNVNIRSYFKYSSTSTVFPQYYLNGNSASNANANLQKGEHTIRCELYADIDETILLSKKEVKVNVISEQRFSNNGKVISPSNALLITKENSQYISTVTYNRTSITLKFVLENITGHNYTVKFGNGIVFDYTLNITNSLGSLNDNALNSSFNWFDPKGVIVEVELDGEYASMIYSNSSASSPMQIPKGAINNFNAVNIVTNGENGSMLVYGLYNKTDN